MNIVKFYQVFPTQKVIHKFIHLHCRFLMNVLSENLNRVAMLNWPESFLHVEGLAFWAAGVHFIISNELLVLVG